MLNHQAGQLHEGFQCEEAALLSALMRSGFTCFVSQQTVGDVEAYFYADFEEFADSLVSAQ